MLCNVLYDNNYNSGEHNIICDGNCGLGAFWHCVSNEWMHTIIIGNPSEAGLQASLSCIVITPFWNVIDSY